MPIVIDLHTHTLMSGHAYSSIEENISGTKRAGLQGLAITDHGPSLPGAPTDMYFTNLLQIPRWLDDVFVLRGAEANIVDYDGRIDLSPRALKRIDLCIASFHEVCIKPGTRSQHTAAWEVIVAHPLIDILGHPGRGEFAFDIEHIVRLCKRENKLVEINNHTLDFKKNHDDCREIALACMRHGVPVVVNSDAHFSRSIGRVDLAEALLAEIDFPQELVLNANREQVVSYLIGRKPHLKGLD